MPESNPGAAQNPISATVIFKRYLEAVHGTVGKYGHIHHCRQKEKIVRPVLPYLPPQICLSHEKIIFKV
jgi:hypothetical protein